MEGLLAIAILIERFTELTIAPLFDKYDWPRSGQMYVSLALGLAISFISQLNAFTFMPGLADIPPTLGYLITGILLGGGASLAHEFLAAKNP